ncbi:unnamed protein product [Polarella glacialis]|uniref:Uncharacterized protein n=1 Tax=Polarella glacialis TaxID=89957 RepID=A0A813JRM7_POLGL|nr:unnamed protein product [Polarella glacialis]
MTQDRQDRQDTFQEMKLSQHAMQEQIAALRIEVVDGNNASSVAAAFKAGDGGELPGENRGCCSSCGGGLREGKGIADRLAALDGLAAGELRSRLDQLQTAVQALLTLAAGPGGLSLQMSPTLVARAELSSEKTGAVPRLPLAQALVSVDAEPSRPSPDPPLPPPAALPAPDAEQAISPQPGGQSPLSTLSPAACRPLGGTGDVHLQVDLRRPTIQTPWGMRWDGNFFPRKRILEEVVEDSPAGRWNEEQKALGQQVLEKGDELVQINSRVHPEGVEDLQNLLESQFVFLRQPRINGKAVSYRRKSLGSAAGAGKLAPLVQVPALEKAPTAPVLLLSPAEKGQKSAESRAEVQLPAPSEQQQESLQRQQLDLERMKQVNDENRENRETITILESVLQKGVVGGGGGDGGVGVSQPQLLPQGLQQPQPERQEKLERQKMFLNQLTLLAAPEQQPTCTASGSKAAELEDAPSATPTPPAAGAAARREESPTSSGAGSAELPLRPVGTASRPETAQGILVPVQTPWTAPPAPADPLPELRVPTDVGPTLAKPSADELTRLATLLAQGEAGSALDLVQPLLRKPRRGASQEESEAVSTAEAARFLLEVMAAMEASSVACLPYAKEPALANGPLRDDSDFLS